MTINGGKPHTNIGDRGQRYEVSYYDPETNSRKVIGWANFIAGYQSLVRGINMHLSWKDPEVFDREKDEKVKL